MPLGTLFEEFPELRTRLGVDEVPDGLVDEAASVALVDRAIDQPERILGQRDIHSPMHGRRTPFAHERRIHTLDVYVNSTQA